MLLSPENRGAVIEEDFKTLIRLNGTTKIKIQQHQI